jgi:hypothetical protein
MGQIHILFVVLDLMELNRNLCLVRELIRSSTEARDLMALHRNLIVVLDLMGRYRSQLVVPVLNHSRSVVLGWLALNRSQFVVAQLGLVHNLCLVLAVVVLARCHIHQMKVHVAVLQALLHHSHRCLVVVVGTTVDCRILAVECLVDRMQVLLQSQVLVVIWLVVDRDSCQRQSHQAR